MPASSLVPEILNIVQCRIGALRIMPSVSCMMMAYDLVPAGPAVHSSPGNVFPWYCVFWNGMSPMCLNAGEVTVSFAPPLAGSVLSADMVMPTSVSGGGACAKADGDASGIAADAVRRAGRGIDGAPVPVSCA